MFNKITLAQKIYAAANTIEKNTERSEVKESLSVMRKTAAKILFEKFEITEINVLSKDFPYELAKLMLEAQYYNSSIDDFGSQPENHYHFFLYGNKLLVVVGDDALENEYCDYLVSVYQQIEAYLALYVGQEPLKAAVYKLAKPLFQKLSEGIELDSEINDM